MRISDWSSDVCSSDLSFSASRTEFGIGPGSQSLIRIRPLAVVSVASACARMMPGLASRPPQLPEWCRSEEHTSELQSLMRISYAVFCLKKKKNTQSRTTNQQKQERNTKERKTILSYYKLIDRTIHRQTRMPRS